MPFQPFGYAFEVRSALAPEAVKAAIRSRKKGWFDMKDGARGWVLGPIICLRSGKSRSDPGLVGRISPDNMGTRISGRAGYLGASIGILILTPISFLLLCLMLTTSGYTLKNFASLAVLIGINSCLFWLDHGDAETLVRFLRNTVGKQDRPQRAEPAAAAFSKALKLEISGSVLDEPATADAVREGLLGIDGDGFVILSSGKETYLQTAAELDGYIVEKREGGELHHYGAVRRGETQNGATEVFTFEEALAIFFAYGSDTPMPSFLEWKKMRG